MCVRVLSREMYWKQRERENWAKLLSVMLLCRRCRRRWYVTKSHREQRNSNQKELTTQTKTESIVCRKMKKYCARAAPWYLLYDFTRAETIIRWHKLHIAKCLSSNEDSVENNIFSALYELLRQRPEKGMRKRKWSTRAAAAATSPKIYKLNWKSLRSLAAKPSLWMNSIRKIY